MACDCTTYTCLDFVRQYTNCPEFLTVELEAAATATYTWEYEFNGRWFGGSIDVTNGENIVLPWVFNESYIHVIKFYDATGDLLNNTCYKLDTNKIPNTYTTPSSEETNYLNVTLTADMLSTDGDGNQVVTISGIAGRTIVFVADGNQLYNAGSFSQPEGDNEFTMTNGASFYAGQIITLLFA